MLKYGTATVMLSLTKAHLEGAPKYSDAEVPSYDPTYGRTVNDYDGVGW